MYLLPEPQQCTLSEGVYIIEYDRKIVIDVSCSEEVLEYARILKEDLKTYGGYGLAVTRGESKKAAVMLITDNKMEREAYMLEVSRKGIVITGGSDAGVLYGIQTLRQMIRQEGACIPCLKIEDCPAIPNRGLYYDVTRGRIPTLSYLKKLVDKMSFYKLNQLQLYIEHSFLFENLSEVWRDDTPLTAEEILELDAYCRKRNIELVPSIASFGHLYKILRTKSYCHLCELPGAEDQPFGFVDRMEHHTLDVSNPESIQFAMGLIEEYLPLFTSNYFNICADETFDLGMGRSKALAEREGIERIYLDYVKQLCEFLVEKGKIPMFWGDIICGFPEAVRELPKETICLNWGYEWNQTEESVCKLAQAGADQYCCPAVCGWNQFVNRIGDAYENIRRMCSYALKYGAIGVLTTDWGDCGHINHPDFGVTGMIYGAAFSWNHTIPYCGEDGGDRAGRRLSGFDAINRQISRIEFHDTSESLVSVIAEISEHWIFQWHDAVSCMEQRRKAFRMEELIRTEGEIDALEKIKVQLYRLVSGMGVECRELIKPYIVAIQGMELIQKAGVIFGAREYQEPPVMDMDGKKLAGELEEWFYEYKKVWRNVSRESELYRIQNVIFWYADYLRDDS